MLRTKVCSLLLCICLVMTGCSKQKTATEVLYTEALITSGTSSYHTTQVIKGDFEKEESFQGSVYIPVMKQLCYQNNGQQVIFDKYLVKKGDIVKKDTPVAGFILGYDKVALAEKELKLKRAQEDYENKCSTYEKEITDTTNAYHNLPDGFDKDVLNIKLKKKEIEFEQYKYNTESGIRQMKQELEAYKNSLSVTELYAPMDGIVSQLDTSKEEGDIVKPEDVLATIYSEDVILFKADDINHSLRYNMEVSLEITYKKNEYDIKGRVISASNSFLSSGNSDEVIIEAIDELNMDVDWAKVENIKVKAVTIRMKDALMVEAGSIIWDNKTAYVQFLDGDTIHKRSVTVADDNGEYCWIVKGAEEGQTIVMRKQSN